MRRDVDPNQSCPYTADGPGLSDPPFVNITGSFFQPCNSRFPAQVPGSLQSCVGLPVMVIGWIICKSPLKCIHGGGLNKTQPWRRRWTEHTQTIMHTHYGQPRDTTLSNCMSLERWKRSAWSCRLHAHRSEVGLRWDATVLSWACGPLFAVSTLIYLVPLQTCQTHLRMIKLYI